MLNLINSTEINININKLKSAYKPSGLSGQSLSQFL